MKLRRLKHETGKFFGWAKDRWARLGGRHGKKRSYGHFSGMADMRTRVEIQDADFRRDVREGEYDINLRRVPVLFEVDEDTDEATGQVLPFCSLACRSAYQPGQQVGIRYDAALVEPAEAGCPGVHCTQCDKELPAGDEERP